MPRDKSHPVFDNYIAAVEQYAEAAKTFNEAEDALKQAEDDLSNAQLAMDTFVRTEKREAPPNTHWEKSAKLYKLHAEEA